MDQNSKPLTALQCAALEAVATGNLRFEYHRFRSWRTFTRVLAPYRERWHDMTSQINALRKRGLIAGTKGDAQHRLTTSSQRCYHLTYAGAFELYLDGHFILAENRAEELYRSVLRNEQAAKVNARLALKYRVAQH